MKTKPSLLVVIPTFNCEKQIVRVLKQVARCRDLETAKFWVVDNQSVDSTLSESKKLVSKLNLKNVEVFKTVQNNNLGGTIKIAFKFAVRLNYDYVAILHGDDQADLRDLVLMWKLLERGEYSGTILGSRFSRKSRLEGYSIRRIIGNVVLNLIYSAYLRKFLTDLGSGLNVYRVQDIRKLNFMNASDALYFNYELLIMMVHAKVPFVYFPIRWRESDQRSNARNLKVFSAALRVLLVSKLKRKCENSLKIYDLVATD